MSTYYAEPSRQDQALDAQRNEEREGDRERAYQKGEENFEALSIHEKIHAIKAEAEELRAMAAGLSEPNFRYEEDSRYLNDEGEDIRDLAAQVEARRDEKELNDFLIQQYEVEQERNIDHANDNKV